jgi:hypothetical protein
MAGTLVICVGPKFSELAGLPRYDQLATMLAEQLPSGRISSAELSDRRELSRNLDLLKRDVPSQEFHRAVELILSGKIQQDFELPALAVLIRALRNRLRAVYTTTLNDLLEKALPDWHSYFEPRRQLAQESKYLFYLRGTLSQRSSWVLGEDEEEREFFDVLSVRRALFNIVFNSSYMLFVGFDEKHGLDTILRLTSHAEEKRPTHFITTDGNLDVSWLHGHGFVVLEADAESMLRKLVDQDGDCADQFPADVVPPAVEGGCPFPGLRAFRYEEREVFHGRRTETSDAVSLLAQNRDQPKRWLAIEGTSGVGKSSFIHAGVVPMLCRGRTPGTPRRWRVATMRPGTTPMTTLVEVTLRALKTRPSELGEDPPHGRPIVDAPTGSLATAHYEFIRLLTMYDVAQNGDGFLLVIDQLEESVTISDREQVGPFSAAIASALTAKLIYLVTTIRSDFGPRLHVGMPNLEWALNNHSARYSLSPISYAGLRAAVLEPLRQFGVQAEQNLIEIILFQAYGSSREETSLGYTGASTLALTAHLMRKLWYESVDLEAGDRLIEIREFQRMKGLTEVLEASADAVLNSLSERERYFAKRLMVRLVVPSDTLKPARRNISLPEARNYAGGGEFADQLIDKLAGADAKPTGQAALLPLIVVREDGRVEAVHDSVLCWSTYSKWIVESWEEITDRDELRRKALQHQLAHSPRYGLSKEHGGLRLLALEVRDEDEDAPILKQFQRDLEAANHRVFQRYAGRLRSREAPLWCLAGVIVGLVAALAMQWMLQ